MRSGLSVFGFVLTCSGCSGLACSGLFGAGALGALCVRVGCVLVRAVWCVVFDRLGRSVRSCGVCSGLVFVLVCSVVLGVFWGWYWRVRRCSVLFGVRSFWACSGAGTDVFGAVRCSVLFGRVGGWRVGAHARAGWFYTERGACSPALASARACRCWVLGAGCWPRCWVLGALASLGRVGVSAVRCIKVPPLFRRGRGGCWSIFRAGCCTGWVST